MTVAPRRSPADGERNGLHVLVVDDHALFADGLALLLEQLAGDVRVTRACSCEAALEGPLTGEVPDLILCDLKLPGVSHLDALRLLVARAPDVPVVAVSADERPQVIAEVLRVGARGYIPKSTGATTMLGALRLVLSGAVYVPDAIVRDGGLSGGREGLTRREEEVLDHLIEGLGNRAIADRLDIAESTVRVHVTSILRRHGVNSRAALLVLPGIAERRRRAGG